MTSNGAKTDQVVKKPTSAVKADKILIAFSATAKKNAIALVIVFRKSNKKAMSYETDTKSHKEDLSQVLLQF